MGNAASAEASSEEIPANKSGVFLSEELNAKIVNEFQSTVIKEEWEKHQKYVLAKGNKRRLADHEATEAINQQMTNFRQQNELVQNQLNQQIDDLKSKFTDISTAMQFDTERLDGKVASIKAKDEMEAPCLAARTNVTMCLDKNGTLKCADFINALEKCAGEAIGSSQ